MIYTSIYGAYIKGTSIYEYPKFANKNENYICTDCSRDVIYCKGKIIKPYFRHKKDNTINKCNHYDKIGSNETEDHKEGKKIIKSILENKKELNIKRKCNRNCFDCNNIENHTLNIKQNYKIIIEYSYIINNKKYIADIAIVDENNNIIYIIEILNTHKTIENSRLNFNWFEIDVKDILTNDINNEYFFCNRECYRCNECLKKGEEYFLEQQKKIEEKKLQQIKEDKKKFEEKLNKILQKKIQEIEQEKLKEQKERIQKIKQEQKDKKNFEENLNKILQNKIQKIEQERIQEIKQEKLKEEKKLQQIKEEKLKKLKEQKEREQKIQRIKTDIMCYEELKKHQERNNNNNKYRDSIIDLNKRIENLYKLIII